MAPCPEGEGLEGEWGGGSPEEVTGKACFLFNRVKMERPKCGLIGRHGEHPGKRSAGWGVGTLLGSL